MIRGIDERLDDDAAGVIEQHVDAPEARHDVRHGGVHGFALRHIGGEQFGCAACRANSRHDFLACIGIDIDHGDLRAFLREQQRRRAARAGCTA